MPRFFSIVLFLLVSSWSLPLAAADQWSEPAPGVSLLLRTADGPLRMHATVVDLSHDDLYIRATRPEQRGQTVSAFAQQVGAVVAINGDWFASGYQPQGLAVGQGVHWEGTADAGWSLIGCTVERDCVYDDHTVDSQLHWRWYDVVGGNGWRLVVDGQIPAYPPDAFYSTREPRSAVGTSADGKTMIFVVVEGRRADSIGIGFHDLAVFMQELGAHQALMLDGGGSSTLTVNGNRVSQLPSNQASERVVANHLAILRGTPDPQCAATPNGRYCEGSVIHTCQGGAHQGQGDCAAFGASCGVTSDGVGVCNHPDCIHGPDRSFCESNTVIVTCSYGRPEGSGDCAAFGATCEDGEDDAYCVHFECTHGANARWCGDAQTLRECIDGQPQDDVDCGASGQVCSDGLPGCVDEQCLGREDETFCVGDEQIQCQQGVASALGSCGDDTGALPDDDSGTDGLPPPSTDDAPAESCACSATGSTNATWVWALAALAWIRRRRSASRGRSVPAPRTRIGRKQDAQRPAVAITGLDRDRARGLGRRRNRRD
jgi:uncharacterized protein (TIGR03382 family)